ncbi:hypothetical protein Psta_2141 [Pirellula staleyi DSM 6068]|uniref:Uncharacterized protein n=1 Tax=Pirellula staleyi (strain ATCC 27377 / DSM 6068 / ICPB 4128) TaxID=530564 RepID=D2R1U6_PIRSD|nr:hypothetical protein [Pirellula staleyi]ADB16815.1 hypothetical protein Psta_2141 [Pirellula staleyi DSM 6068]
MKNSSPLRRGTTISEAVIALALISVAMVGVAQLIFVARQTQTVGLAQRASLSELASLAEHCRVLAPEEVSSATIEKLPMSAQFAQLRQAKTHAVVTKVDGSPAATLIQLSLSYIDHTGSSHVVGPISIWRFDVPPGRSAEVTP